MFPILSRHVAGQRRDGQQAPSVGGPTTQQLNQFEAVDHGHADVDEDDIGKLSIQELESGAGGSCSRDRRTLCLQDRLQRRARRLVVVDDKDTHALQRQ
jgi:hypothetical protein